MEENLAKNLESFFALDYPEYEIIFCVADKDDPAVEVVEAFLKRHPDQNARLLISEGKVGPNPKVNNIIQGYGEAKHDWILISDSNVRVKPSYLHTVTEKFTDEVGIVTAVVGGCEPEAAGGWLEAVFLNTFYARWMIVSRQMGVPVVVGKSMLFRRSDARRFGGLAVLGRYLAEDYMAGQAMKLLGKKIEIMSIPIRQPLGHYPFRSFWSRHLRWGRIRKSQAPQAFCFEPLLSFWVSGIAGALSLQHLVGVPFSIGIVLHIGLWAAADLNMLRIVSPEIFREGTWRVVIAWLARETLHMPLWIHIAVGSTVKWRGKKLVLARGGMLKV